MQLSEAMRLGAMLRPQARGGPFQSSIHVSKDGEWSRVVASCALGAAHEALGGGTQSLSYTPLKHFDALLTRRVLQPCTCYDAPGSAIMPTGRIDATVMHLNDHHGWTREQIADWLATHETPADDVDVPGALRPPLLMPADALVPA